MTSPSEGLATQCAYCDKPVLWTAQRLRRRKTHPASFAVLGEMPTCGGSGEKCSIKLAATLRGERGFPPMSHFDGEACVILQCPEERTFKGWCETHRPGRETDSVGRFLKEGVKA